MSKNQENSERESLINFCQIMSWEREYLTKRPERQCQATFVTAVYQRNYKQNERIDWNDGNSKINAKKLSGNSCLQKQQQKIRQRCLADESSPVCLFVPSTDMNHYEFFR